MSDSQTVGLAVACVDRTVLKFVLAGAQFERAWLIQNSGRSLLEVPGAAWPCVALVINIFQKQI